jgi:hypothetical protein
MSILAASVTTQVVLYGQKLLNRICKEYRDFFNYSLRNLVNPRYKVEITEMYSLVKVKLKLSKYISKLIICFIK